MDYGFYNKFIKAMTICSKFQKHLNINLFIFNIKDYELIQRRILNIKRNKCRKIYFSSGMASLDL